MTSPAPAPEPAPPPRSTSPSTHDAVYRVRFDEAGPDGMLRTSALMRYAQDLAWLHSTALGFGREWYAERGLTWLVRAAELAVLVGVPMGTEIDARTEVVGMRRVFARRRAAFRDAAGQLAAWAHTDWVLIDARGSLTRIPPVFVEMFGGAGLDAAIGRVDPGPTPQAATRHELAVRRHELDPLAHANNAVYLDWLEESIAAAGGEEATATVPRRYRLEYVLAAPPATPLEAAAWPRHDGWSFRLTNRGSGADLLRARLEPGNGGPPDDDGPEDR